MTDFIIQTLNRLTAENVSMADDLRRAIAKVEEMSMAEKRYRKALENIANSITCEPIAWRSAAQKALNPSQAGIKMTNKHTPGPWVAADGKILSQNGEMIVGAVDGHEPFYSEPSAPDLALMAAAPELLEALIFMMQCHREPHDKEGKRAYEAALKALAKARGQS